MAETLELLEQRIAELRREVRQASQAGDKLAVRRARVELRAVEQAWEEALERDGAEGPPVSSGVAPDYASAPGPLAGATIPVREQVHQALTVLGACAAPKLISAVHEAFFNDAIVTTKLASLRRDEERSFAAQAYARPYYICAALNHEGLTSARALLAVSTWTLEQRMLGPLGPRIDFLTHAERIAVHVQRIQQSGRQPSDVAWRLLGRFAANVPDGFQGSGRPDPEQVAHAARMEAAVHREVDATQRRLAADRARAQLGASEQLFGAPVLAEARRLGTDRRTAEGTVT
ncbi:hypothetical protein [Kitasatospora sp. NBC_01266]|uniref:hypothetical protein n=1 Tax=Kitasatospora sp. NBC_01266 TaxID=2903572 RepID=UPI002E2FD03E|nr:hypothetical protein [Kitasatospora sp. NBC_01266]